MPAIANAILAEDGSPLIDESGNYIVSEGHNGAIEVSNAPINRMSLIAKICRALSRTARKTLNFIRHTPKEQN